MEKSRECVHKRESKGRGMNTFLKTENYLLMSLPALTFSLTRSLVSHYRGHGRNRLLTDRKSQSTWKVVSSRFFSSFDFMETLKG